jgi:UDP-N-acetylmuramate dehydrogenase
VSTDQLAVDALAAALEHALPGRVARDVSVAELATYRLGGPIAIVVRAGTIPELAALARVLSTSDAPVLVIGRGSNLLVADAGFAGVGVVLDGSFDRIEIDAERAVVRAGGAVALPVVARRAAAAGITGLEFLVGIPGSVGGAVHMNAGGHGSETRDVLERASVFRLAEPEGEDAEVLDVAGLDLSYRHSNLAATDVVTMAELRGAFDDAEACAERVDEIVRWRREHQPGGANAGSVFRNPAGDSAGRLIDAAGCKGLRVGAAVVSEKHANFFQAEPGATADDVHRLVQCVQRRVAEHSGIVLEPELRMLGFGAAADPDAGGVAR